MKAESKRLNLLTHPLVGSLLHHKWKKFGQYGYFINLLMYTVFIISLTTFAFIIQNPRSQVCELITSYNIIINNALLSRNNKEGKRVSNALCSVSNVTWRRAHVTSSRG